MINLFLRLVIGLILSAICFGVAFNYMHIPPDRFLPAPLLYANATSKTVGEVTKTEVLGYGEHFWSGTDNEYYVDYTFQPIKKVQEPDGKVKEFIGPQWYNGAVRIDQLSFQDWNSKLKTQQNPPIQVMYDPLNPAVNGVPGTEGVYTRTAGYLGVWLLYLAGLVVVAIIFEEILKRWMPSE